MQVYDNTISILPSVKRKGATYPYTSHNGWMLSYIYNRREVSLRVAKESRDQFLIDFPNSFSIKHKKEVKDSIKTPEQWIEYQQPMEQLFDRSYLLTASLKSKK